MRRVRLGKVELAEGGTKSFDLGDLLVLLSRFDGGFFAISDWCNHAGCLLSHGIVDGRFVTCPCHGATFDLLTGTNVNAPHLCGDQDVYDLEEEDGEVVVLLPD